MDDTAFLKQEQWELRANPTPLLPAVRIGLWVIGAITLLYGLLSVQVSVIFAGVVLGVAGWFLGRFGAAGTIIDRKRREVVSWWVTGGTRRSTTTSVADAERVIVEKKTTGAWRGQRAVTSYDVSIVRKGGAAVLVSTAPTATAARDLAQKVGVFLGGVSFDGQIR